MNRQLCAKSLWPLALSCGVLACSKTTGDTADTADSAPPSVAQSDAAAPSASSTVDASAGGSTTEDSSPEGGATPSCPTLTGASGSITDASGNVWTLVASNGSLIVDENGAPAGSTLDVLRLVYVGHVVSQENTWDNWYAWDGSGWTEESDPTGACSGPDADAGSSADAGVPNTGPSMAIPPFVTAVGYTNTYLFDDFTTQGTIGSGTSGTNWYLNTSIGATAANAAVNTTATAASMNGGNAGSFASPNGGILDLNGPDYPGSGNITISSTPPSSQKSYTPSFGSWMHAYFETYAKFDPTFQFNGQWFAWWFDPQVVTNDSFNEVDGFENFCGNYNYPNSQISFSGHQWDPTDGTDVASGGGAIGTVSNGTFTPIAADGNWHRYGVLWVSTGAGTGYIEMYYDNQLLVTYDRFAAGLGGQIPTGAGGWSGFQTLESGAPLYMMFGGPPGSDFLVDYARVIGP
jgi:hypothetical protein